MADKLVCVGGPADGSSRSIDDGCRHVEMITRREHAFRYDWGEEMPREVVAVETAVYRREKIRVLDRDIEFLCYAKMTPFDAVKKLLEDHRP